MADGRLHAAGLIIMAVAFGGGGINAALFNLVVQLAALFTLALHPRAFIDFFRRAPRFPKILIGLSLALPLLQSIPLPPAVWQALPGRDVALETYRFTDQPDIWMALSQDLRRTLIAFLALVPPLALVILTWDLPRAQQRQLLLVLVGTGIAMVLLGAMQMASGNRALMLFGDYAGPRYFGSSYLLGTFQNHNPACLFLVLTLNGLVGATPARPSSRSVAGGSFAALILTMGIVTTGSRSGMAIAVLPFALAAFGLLKAPVKRRLSLRVGIAGLAGLAGLAGGIGYVASNNARIHSSIERFSNLQDDRSLIWADMEGAISRFWPVGSGIGTLDEVFQLDESLENLAPGRAARAHNEYLEVALESGLAGLALLGAWIVFLSLRCMQSLRSSRLELAAATGLVALAIQSISDFPLRFEAVLCAAGLLLALLVKAPSQRRGERSGNET